MAAKAIGRHLWYVSELLIMMALFDERVSVEEKAAMVKAALVRKNVAPYNLAVILPLLRVILGVSC